MGDLEQGNNGNVLILVKEITPFLLKDSQRRIIGIGHMDQL